MLNMFDIKSYTDIDFNDTIYIEERNGPFAHICPHCKSVNFIDVELSVKVRASTHAKTDLEVHGIRYTIECQSCGKKFITHDQGIDPNIIDVICILNDAGYETTYSCEGHFNDTRGQFVSRPYIVFADTSIKRIKAPRGWKYKPFGDGSLIMEYDNAFYDNIDKEKALISLNKWAEKKIKERGNKFDLRNIYRCFNKNI